MDLDRDDMEFLLAGCRPFGFVGILASVERALSAYGIACVADPLTAWRRRRARNRLFRAWLSMN